MMFIKDLKSEEFKHIFVRNVFLLTNGIIFSVVVMLFIFGQIRAGIFLGIISLANMIAGLTQDIRAWRNLEKLQLLTAPHVVRANQDGTESTVLIEDIKNGDLLKLKIGDQVPCDGTLENVLGLEVNEGLITGESNSYPRKKGDDLLAGSIITAGSGSMRTKSVFKESRIARMTEGIKKHSLNASPIQQAANLVVKYTGYMLIIAIIFVVIRGFIAHENIVSIVLNIGTLASMLVPQGLVFTITLFFAYGAANLYRKNVLLQEINATEKLGRIKNLCMDKTGTLTENALAIENMYLPPNVTLTDAENLTASYINGTADVSEITRGLNKFLKDPKPFKVFEAQPFSSWRQYGAVRIKKDHQDMIIFVGSPDIFLRRSLANKDQQWLQNLLDVQKATSKHVLCVMQATAAELPNNLAALKLSVVAVFIFHNNIRPGIQDTVNFFQNRGVKIRIISGDNLETVKAVSARAGVKNSNHAITGREMDSWDMADYEKNVENYAIFARIVPEQKEKIIQAFKKNGFTAMVGDGANDALAIKKADLGIAMFDGAPATRKLASIVLVNNSFTALPGGVSLADGIIRNIEIFSSIFFNQTAIGLFLFILLGLFGREYPLTPFNVTFINYFTIDLTGLIISYWTIKPHGIVPPVGTQPFLKRVMPFALWSAAVQALGISLVYALNFFYFKILPPNTLMVLMFIILGFVFFIFAPSVYQGTLDRIKKKQIFILGIFGLVIMFIAFQISWVRLFFNINVPLLSWHQIITLLSIVSFFSLLQYGLAKKFHLYRQNEAS